MLRLSLIADGLVGKIVVGLSADREQIGMSSDFEADTGIVAGLAVVAADRALVRGNSAWAGIAVLEHQIVEHKNRECSARELSSWRHCW